MAARARSSIWELGRIANLDFGKAFQHGMVLDGRFREVVGKAVWRHAGSVEDAEECGSNAIADIECVLQWLE